jgi:leucyl aminopeptidase
MSSSSPLKVSITALAMSALFALSAKAQTTPNFATEANLEGRDITLFVGEGGALQTGGLSLDDAVTSRIEAAIASTKFKGKFGKALHLHALAPFDTVTIIGVGDQTLDARHLAELGGHIRAAQDEDGDAVILSAGIDTTPDAAAHLAFGYALRGYEFTRYKSRKEEDASARTQTPVFLTNAPSEAAARWSSDLVHLVEGVFLARDMGTEPGNTIYPQAFVDRVRAAFRGVADVRIEVMDAAAIRRAGMGALMGVGQGSIHDPRLMVITYRGTGAPDAPIALVGKGITFDTGGISIKPNDGMWAMKSDLSGAAAVAGTVLAAAKRGAPVHVVGVMPLAENMPSQDAIRPGDVLTTMSGQTIEIISTDAEGRLILADAVRYTQDRHEPSLLINIATLTGAAARALDDDYAAIITRDYSLSEALMELGLTIGEDVWPLPLNEDHFEAIKSDIADIKNTGGNPGASIGAAFVGSFIDEDQEWVHIDMAGVDWLNTDKPVAPKGHHGWGVRFLDGVLRARHEG